MKQLIAALFCLWVAGCAGEESPEKSLPLCWNVNKLGPGRFAGQGIFVTSYEGLGLQAPGCDDRGGHNTYEFAPATDQVVLQSLQNLRGARLIGFNFHGHTKWSNSGQVLIIDRINRIEAVGEPRWMAHLERTRAGTAVAN